MDFNLGFKGLNGGAAPLNLSLGLRSCIVNVMSRSIPATRLHRGLDVLQIRSGRFGEDKTFARAGNRNKVPGFLGLSLLTAPTALFTILYIRVKILQTIALLSVVTLESGVLKERLVCGDI
jgi:hypothetical protein